MLCLTVLMAMRNVRELVAPLARPAAHVVVVDVPTRSHFGGLPNLPPDLPWPKRDGTPLTFLARLSLSELQRAQAFDWLPTSGALLFFYDFEEPPWGNHPNDCEFFSVLQAPDLTFMASPEAANTDDAGRSLPHRNVGFRPIQSLPSVQIIPGERELIREGDLTEKEFKEYVELTEEEFRGTLKNQVGGFPWPMQWDIMELDCQLASHGLYSHEHDSPRAIELSPGAADWRLLFQIDEDEVINKLFSSMIYFWVREQDARAGVFEYAWVTAQCD
jgi:uncharacterized protein YwqG